jgi:hypothetical protein
MTREDLLTTYHQYKKNYLEVMGWDMKETFEEWLQRMEDIDSFLIQDAQAHDPRSIKLYEGTQIAMLVEQGLSLSPIREGWDVVRDYLYRL